MIIINARFVFTGVAVVRSLEYIQICILATEQYMVNASLP
jgi:hypothetical protein